MKPKKKPSNTPQPSRRLAVERQTLRSLSTRDLANVAGGARASTYSCRISDNTAGG